MARTKIYRTDQWLLMLIGLVFAAILVLLPLHAFFSTWLGTSFGNLLVWKSWKEIIIFILVPFVVWLCALRPDITQQVWKSPLNKLIAAYVVITLLLAIKSMASTEAVIAGLLMNLRFFAMFIIAQVLVASDEPWISKLKKWLIPWLLAVTVFLGIMAILQVTVIPKDFLANFGYDKEATIAPYILIDENQSALRAFATMRGPNTLASYLLLPLALAALLWWKDRKKRWLLGIFALCAVAIFLTQSRSGWLGATAVLAVVAWLKIPRAQMLKCIRIGIIPFIAVVILGLWLATSVPQLRLLVFHSGGDSQSESLLAGSSQQHWQAAVDGIKQIGEYPFGKGVGTAGPASYYNTTAAADISEDYFVQIGEEVGLIGLALFLAITAVVAIKLFRQHTQLWPLALLASFIGINIMNLFLHAWADDPTAMTWWGIAGLYISAKKL